MKFKEAIISYLEKNKTGDLYILSDFYALCCEVLELPTIGNKAYKSNKAKIQKELRKLKNGGLIDSRVIGTGFAGKSDFGATRTTIYFLPSFL